MRIQRSTTRAAFTLVELLVAMALILFIMSIMAQAIGAGSKVFTSMRTAGQLQERLRGSIVIVRRDLANDHFGPPFGANRGGPHLGDQRLDQAGWSPPYAGYVEIGQVFTAGYEPSMGLGLPNGLPLPVLADSEGLYSTRNTSCMMRFTVRLPDGPAPELYSAAYHPRFASDPTINAFPGLAPMVYSRWAEVCYFLTPRGTTPGGLPFYSLHRRVRLLPTKGVTFLLTAAEYTQVVNDVASNRYPDMVSPILPGTPAPAPPFPAGSMFVRVPGPEDINTNRALRIQATPHPTGDDVVMTDVLSFEIKAAWFNNPVFNALVNGSSPPGTTMPLNSDEPFSDLPLSTLNPSVVRLFDTWFQSNVTDGIDWENPLSFNGVSRGFLNPPLFVSPPLRINVRALQIKMRIWDPRAETARQATIVQEL